MARISACAVASASASTWLWPRPTIVPSSGGVGERGAKLRGGGGAARLTGFELAALQLIHAHGEQRARVERAAQERRVERVEARILEQLLRDRPAERVAACLEQVVPHE